MAMTIKSSALAKLTINLFAAGLQQTNHELQHGPRAFEPIGHNHRSQPSRIPILRDSERQITDHRAALKRLSYRRSPSSIGNGAPTAHVLR